MRDGIFFISLHCMAAAALTQVRKSSQKPLTPASSYSRNSEKMIDNNTTFADLLNTWNLQISSKKSAIKASFHLLFEIVHRPSI